jgi:hypothetical protein
VTVGRYSTDGGFSFSTVAYRWSGTSWTSYAPPTPGELSGIVCKTTTTCFAVGYNLAAGGATATTLAVQWNKSGYELLSSPSEGTYSQLYGLSCPAVANCVAVGNFSQDSPGTTRSTLTEHYS